MISKPDKGTGVLLLNKADYLSIMNKILYDHKKCVADVFQKDCSSEDLKSIIQLVDKVAGNILTVIRPLEKFILVIATLFSNLFIHKAIVQYRTN